MNIESTNDNTPTNTAITYSECYRLPLLSSNSPTHYIECFQNHGKGFKKRVFDECIFISKALNGQAKVLVTKSHRKSKGHFRYVDFSKLINIYEQTKI